MVIPVVAVSTINAKIGLIIKFFSLMRQITRVSIVSKRVLQSSANCSLAASVLQHDFDIPRGAGPGGPESVGSPPRHLSQRLAVEDRAPAQSRLCLPVHREHGASRHGGRGAEFGPRIHQPPALFMSPCWYAASVRSTLAGFAQACGNTIRNRV